jgi:alkanesulfonate monooxygenase SsuD/methylene tetrahydromethanopterin reductase-like flavin-dependent oxidoreductase (luciferase family)
MASLREGRPIRLPPPSREWTRDASAPAESGPGATRVSFVGSPGTVSRQMAEFVASTHADELIVVSHIWDHAARLRSYEITAAA